MANKRLIDMAIDELDRATGNRSPGEPPEGIVVGGVEPFLPPPQVPEKFPFTSDDGTAGAVRELLGNELLPMSERMQLIRWRTV